MKKCEKARKKQGNNGTGDASKGQRNMVSTIQMEENSEGKRVEWSNMK